MANSQPVRRVMIGAYINTAPGAHCANTEPDSQGLADCKGVDW